MIHQKRIIENNIITIYINGKPQNIKNIYTILQVCLKNNIEIPRFCYYEKLSIAGNCRMCMVEILKNFKPVISCATTIMQQMHIYTDTALVKNAREHILEFLLINHPLDCPICDQAGECDLQDQTIIYGSDRGRFKEKKRSVIDKNLGLFIKTIMTRCIHCTRCIRFSQEIANNPIIGTNGRGKNTEIGMYINNTFDSILSGNLIDICPVGALTSKPYAFTARSWELRNTETIDILDSTATAIRVDIKGSEIMRILPKTNNNKNENWITDKIRFCYDSLKKQRITLPIIRKKNMFINSSWQTAFNIIKQLFVFNIIKKKKFYYI